MKPLIFATKFDGGVLLTIHATASIALLIDPAQAEALALELLRAVGEARARMAQETTRVMCRACQKDCAECICARCAICETFGKACCKMHQGEAVRS